LAPQTDDVPEVSHPKCECGQAGPAGEAARCLVCSRCSIAVDHALLNTSASIPVDNGSCLRSPSDGSRSLRLRRPQAVPGKWRSLAAAVQVQTGPDWVTQGRSETVSLGQVSRCSRRQKAVQQLFGPKGEVTKVPRMVGHQYNTIQYNTCSGMKPDPAQASEPILRSWWRSSGQHHMHPS
jgi:hypothetical protein